METGYRVDLVVEGRVLVEIKSVLRLERIHEAQLLSYLRLSDASVGLLLDFNEVAMRAGVQRVVNAYRGPPLTASTTEL